MRYVLIYRLVIKTSNDAGYCIYVICHNNAIIRRRQCRHYTARSLIDDLYLEIAFAAFSKYYRIGQIAPGRSQILDDI